MTKKTDLRIERDAQGEVSIPQGVYWGVQTARAREVSVDSSKAFKERLLDALIMTKKAAAIANFELGAIDLITSRSIRQCCDEITGGQFRDQFLTDKFLASGNCLNDNVNEVLANRANETLGGKIGHFEYVHPQKDVNCNQSTEDAYPTAIRLAVGLQMRELELVVLDLERLLRRKSLEFERTVKIGRTSLKDCLPVTLGQEFNGYANTIEKALRRLKDATLPLLELNIGATYVGTGLGVEPLFTEKIISQLAQLSGLSVRQADDFFRISQSMADYVEFASAMKLLAVELIKIGNDLRLLNSGPTGGLGEIKMPVNFAHIMPANLPDRANDILLDTLLMSAYQVLGSDQIVTLCAQAGQLEGNCNLPLIAETILSSMELLKNTLHVFNQKCLFFVQADTAHCRQLLLNSANMALVLITQIGEENTKSVLLEAKQTGKAVEEIILEQQLMTKEAFEKNMYLRPLTRSGPFPGASDRKIKTIASETII